MKPIKFSKITIAFIILSVAYWIVALFVPGKTLIDIINGAFLGVSISIVIVYAPLFSYAVWTKKFDRVSQLSLGIGFLVLSVIVQRGWSLYARSFPVMQRTPLFNNPFVGYAALLSVIGGIFLVMAPGFDAEASVQGMNKNKYLVFISLIFGALSAAIFSYFQLEKV